MTIRGGEGACRTRRCAYACMYIGETENSCMRRSSILFLRRTRTKDRVTGDVRRRLDVCSRGSCFIISSYNALWGVTTSPPLRSPMLLLLSPKGAIGGWGSESDGFENATRSGRGGRGVLIEGVSLPVQCTRYPCSRSIALVVAKRLGLHCLIRIIPRKRVAAHSDSAMCSRSDY